MAHAMCSCCWTHGIWNESTELVRQSLTLRVYDPQWGRRTAEEAEHSVGREAQAEPAPMMADGEAMAHAAKLETR